MMLVVCFTFIVLWLPQALILLTTSDAHSHNNNKNEIVTSLAALSGLLNSALNFILYCMTVQRFRDAALVSIRRTLCCKLDEGLSSVQGTLKSSLTKKTSDKRSKLNPSANSSRKISTPAHHQKLMVIYHGSKTINSSEKVSLLIVNNRDSASERSSSSKLTPSASFT